MNVIALGYILTVCVGVSVAQVQQYLSQGYSHCSTASCTHGRCGWDYTGYVCICNQGYEQPPSRSDYCVDKNECNIRPSVCTDGTCINYIGTYQCRCNHGYKEIPNKKGCIYDPDVPFTNTWGFQEFLSSMGYKEPEKFLAPRLETHSSTHLSSHYSPRRPGFVVPSAVAYPSLFPITTPAPVHGARPAGRGTAKSWNAPSELQRPNFLASNRVIPTGNTPSFQADNTFASRDAYSQMPGTSQGKYPIKSKGSPPTVQLNKLQNNNPNVFQDQSGISSQKQFTNQNVQQPLSYNYGQSQYYNTQPQTWVNPNVVTQTSQSYVAPSYNYGAQNSNWMGPQYPNSQYQPQQQQQYWPQQSVPVSIDFGNQAQYNRQLVQLGSQFSNQYQPADNSYTSSHYSNGNYGPNEYYPHGITPKNRDHYNQYASYQPGTNTIPTYNAVVSKQPPALSKVGTDHNVQNNEATRITNTNTSPLVPYPDAASLTSPPPPSPLQENPPSTTPLPSPTSSPAPPPPPSSPSTPIPPTTPPPTLADGHFPTTVTSLLPNNASTIEATALPGETTPLPSTTDTTARYSDAGVTPSVVASAPGDGGQNFQIMLGVDLASFPEAAVIATPDSPSEGLDTRQNTNESTVFLTTVLAADATAISNNLDIPTTTLSPKTYVVNDVLLVDILKPKLGTENSNNPPAEYPKYASVPDISHNVLPVSDTSNTIYPISPAKDSNAYHHSPPYYESQVSKQYYSKSQYTKHTNTAEQNSRAVQPLQQQTLPIKTEQYYQQPAQTYPTTYPKYQSFHTSKNTNSRYNYNVPFNYYHPTSMMHNAESYSQPMDSIWYNLPQTNPASPSSAVHNYPLSSYSRPTGSFGAWARPVPQPTYPSRYQRTDSLASDDIMMAFILSNAF